MKAGQRLKLGLASLWMRAAKGMSSTEGHMAKNAGAQAPEKLYSFKMKTIDGQERPLSDYKGQVLLIVNVASQCGFTPQYEGLEALFGKYKDKGLRILAFPANEFGRQEPGTDAEIKEFCRLNYGVSFDLFSKIVVKGAGQHPLYAYLTKDSPFPGDIGWNFSKFLVDRNGKVAGRFDPPVDPLSRNLVKAIEALLG